MTADLPQRLVQLLQDALLVKHLALITVFIVVVNPLAHVSGELVEGHVLLHLFILRQQEQCQDDETTQRALERKF